MAEHEVVFATTPFLANTLKDPHQSAEDEAIYNRTTATDYAGPLKSPNAGEKDADEIGASKSTLLSVKPRHLGKSRGSLAAEIIYGLLGVLLALMFIVLAALALHLDGKELSEYGGHIVTWSSIGPSIYPIVFAAIVSRCFRKIACWRAERGTSLGVLERLMGSSSLAGSVQSAFSLRRIDIAAISILVIWVLSPVGGQSSLRLLSIVQEPATTNHSIYYARSDTTYYIGGSSHYETEPFATNAIFQSSLLAATSTKDGPTDSWSNPKVPLLQTHIDSVDAVVDPANNLWVDTSLASNVTTYGSLVGLPLQNVPRVGVANFSMETVTFYTDCSRLKTPVTNDTWCEGSKSVVPFTCINYNSAVPTCKDQSFLLNSSFNVYDTGLLNISDTPQYVDLQFVGGGSQWLYGKASGFDCLLKSLRLEANVLCNDGRCAVKRVRRSEFDRRPSFLNPWNEFAPYGEQDGASAYWYQVLLQLSTSTGSAFGTYATPLDNYLYGIDSPYIFNYAFDWHNVTEAAFSRRFTTVLNTFWAAAQGGYVIAGDIFLKPNLSAPVGADGQPGGYYNITTGTVTSHSSVYHAHPLWVTLLFAISVLLLALSGLSAVVGILTLAPDILGHVSSLVRDGPFLQNRSATWMDGGELARRSQGMRVQIADSQPEAAIGSIAFTSVPEDLAPAGALRRGRLYH